MSEIQITDSTLDEVSLAKYGLNQSDSQQIKSLALSLLENNDSVSISSFGRSVSEQTSDYTDNLLEEIRNKDLNEAGEKLDQVVSIAQSLNLGALSERRSKVPVIGGLIDKFRLKAMNISSSFESSKDQIDKILSEVEFTQTNILARNAMLDEMFMDISDEHRLFGVHIVAGRVCLNEMQKNADEMRAAMDKTGANDPAALQAISDIQSRIDNLDKRVGDLIVLQQSAMQSLPVVRMIQASNARLIDKFHTVREITVPSWKKQFVIMLTLDEQENHALLAKSIDDTTNNILKRNAELLHKNAVSAAKANQRLVIDVETLQEVQDKLIKSVQDVIEVQRQGTKDRKDAEAKIIGMRQNLKMHLIGSRV